MKKIVALLFLITQSLLAQIQFEAKASKTTLGINERLRIDFAMNMDGDNFVPPAFEGFKVVGGPSQQVSQSWINGRSSFEKIYSYYLLPTQKGILVIKSAVIEYNGQLYKTAPLKITVTNAVPEARDPNEPQQIAVDDNLYLIADVSKTNPYVNEPVTVVYKLYFSFDIGISNWQELNKPKYNDFWSQNIDIKQLVGEEGMFKGKKYRFVVLRKTVLYPLKSGKLNIEPLTLDVDVQLPTNRRDVFGRVQIVNDNKKASTGTKTINVKPLPEAGKPVDFSGAVGVFDFKATASKNNLKSGESLDLLVHVSGKGNLKLFTLPKPVVPNSLEMYEPVHNENVTTNLAGMAGKISDSYTIIPQYKGNYPIKPISFSYFDLNTYQYKTITAPEIVVNVIDGPTQANVAATPSNQTAKNTIASNEQFKFIKRTTTLEPLQKTNFLGSTLFYGLLFLPLVLIPVLIFAKQKKEAMDKDVFGNRIKANQRLAKKYLSEAKKQIKNKEPFYVALEKALHNFLKAKLHIETSEMSKSNIQDLLLSKNANQETVTNFINLTENCEMARYALTSSSSLQDDFDKAVLIISDLEKQIV